MGSRYYLTKDMFEIYGIKSRQGLAAAIERGDVPAPEIKGSKGVQAKWLKSKVNEHVQIKEDQE